MTSTKNIFSLVISLLLTANVFVGPLAYLHVILFESLSWVRTSTGNLLILPLIWLVFFFLVRVVCESKRLRTPFVVIGALVISVVFLGLIFGSMSAIGPVVFVSALYLISLVTIHFIDPKKRYFVGLVLMSVFLLSMIAIKNEVVILDSCRGLDLNPAITSVQENTQPSELLSIFVTRKCIPSPGGYMTNPATF